MKFTQPCFIRKNTTEIREELERLGYHVCACCTFRNAKWIQNLVVNSTAHGIGYFEEDPPYNWSVEDELKSFLSESSGYIDCGTNEGLFLAIAALSNDTDKNQWFRDWDGRFWKEFDHESFGKNKWSHLERKATVPELIEYFK